MSGKIVNPQKFSIRSEQEAEANRLAIEVAKWLEEHGNIHGPPIPGHFQHWKGIPFRNHQIIHLPHFTKEISEIDEDGREVKTPVEMPFVKPATYFRSIGSIPEDYERDENDRIIINPQTGQPKLIVPQENLRGYQKDYVTVDPNEYEDLLQATRKKGVYASGSLHVNQMSSESQPLEFGHKDYNEKMYQIFGPNPGDGRPTPTTAMKASKLDAYGRVDRTGLGGLFYDDIIKGIRNCLNGDKCGGSTSWERNIGLNNIEEIHQIVVQKMQQNLNDPNMLVSGKRITFARTETSKIMQQDHEGGGTRRRRILDPTLRQTSMDRETSAESGSGSSSATQDIVTQKLKDKGFYKDEIGDIVNRKKLSGHHKFPYDIHQMRALLDELKQEAGMADHQAQVAKERSRQNVGQEIITLLSKSIQDKKIVALQIYELIKKMIEVDGYTTDVEKSANEVMATITQNAQTSEQLVANFVQHPLTKKYADSDELQPRSQPQVEAGEDLDVAIDKLWDEYLNDLGDDTGKLRVDDKMRKALLPQNGEKASQVAKIIASHFPGKEEVIAAGVQDAIYDALDMESPSEKKPPAVSIPPQQNPPKQPIPLRPETPMAAAAKTVGTLSAEERAAKNPDWKVLHSNKDFLALAFHPTFLTMLKKESLESLKAAILHKHGNEADQNEVRQAILNIDEQIQELENAIARRTKRV